MGFPEQEPILDPLTFGYSSGRKRLRQVEDSDEDPFSEKKKNDEQMNTSMK